MQTKGKFYIRANIASALNYYWNQQAQNWTTDPTQSSFFENVDDANNEARHAQSYGPGEAIVQQATRDLED